MKNVFSRYYKIILSSIILVTLLALRENYVAFDEMTGIRSVIRMLLYTAWGGVLSTKIRRNRVEGVEYVCFAIFGFVALNILIPIWEFQRNLYLFIIAIPGFDSIVFLLTGMLAGYIWGPTEKNDKEVEEL